MTADLMFTTQNENGTNSFDVAKTPITRHFGTGAVRGDDSGRGEPSLLPYESLLYVKQCFESIETFPLMGLIHVSKVYQSGAVKYDARNWEKGIPCSDFVDSAMRHYAKFVGGHIDEPHCGQIGFNLLGLLQTSLWCSEGVREAALMDLPSCPCPLGLNINGMFTIELYDTAMEHIDVSIHQFWKFLATGQGAFLVAAIAHNLRACELYFG